MFPIHVCIESFTIYILTKSNSFKFQLLQNWFSGIVARLDRFHEKLLRHAIFKWGPVTEKFSNWEFSFFSFLISTVEVTFVQIWANSERKNPTSKRSLGKIWHDNIPKGSKSDCSLSIRSKISSCHGTIQNCWLRCSQLWRWIWGMESKILLSNFLIKMTMFFTDKMQ